MENLKAIFKKIVNKETILYVVFGVLTTLVNFVAFKLFTMVFDKLISSQLGVHISNVLAWIFAVAFAYVTNKLFVFESKSWEGKVLAKEIPSFVAARLFSLGVEELGLIIFVTSCTSTARFSTSADKLRPQRRNDCKNNPRSRRGYSQLLLQQARYLQKEESSRAGKGRIKQKAAVQTSRQAHGGRFFRQIRTFYAKRLAISEKVCII